MTIYDLLIKKNIRLLTVYIIVKKINKWRVILLVQSFGCVCAIVACVFETGTALYTAWDVFYQWDGQTCRLMTRFVPSCSSWKSEIHSERHIWEFKLLELSMLMFSSLRDTKTTKNCLFLLLAIRLLWTWGSLKS